MQNDTKKKMKHTAAAAATAAGVLVGGLFNSPGDLLNNPGESSADRTLPPLPIEIVREETEEEAELPERLTGSGAGGAGSPGTSGAGVSDARPEKIKTGIRAYLTGRITKLPLAVRAAAGVPLWCIGWVLLHSASAAWTAVLLPVFRALFGWILVAGLILLTAVITVKTVAPSVPLKKILSKRTLLFTVSGVVVLAIADTVLPYVWDAYDSVSLVIKIVGSSALLGIIVRPFILQ